MSLRTRLFTGIFAVSACAVVATAQDTAVQPKEGDQRIERKRERAGKGMRGEKFGRHGGFGLRGIDLTDAQKEQIRQIREANKPDKSVMDELRTIRQAKHAGTITGDQQARLEALRAQTRDRAKSVHDQMFAVLTAEQKAQLEQRRQEMKQRRDEMRQRMRERRQQRQPGTTKTTPSEPTKVT